MNFERLFPALFMMASLSCETSFREQSESVTQGKVPGLASELVRPQKASKEALEHFAVNLRKVPKTAGPSLGASKQAKAKVFEKAYTDAVADVGGLPREQGEAVLMELVSPTSQACGGVSCSKVFGVEPKEVDDFMNGLMTDVATNASLAKPEAKPLKNVLLGSLVPEKSFTTPEKPWDYIAQIYTAKSTFLPQRFVAPSTIINYIDVYKVTDEKFIEGIEGYTGFHSDQFRKIEASSDVELIAKGFDIEDIKYTRQKITLINEVLQKLPKVTQPVFRGMTDMQGEKLAIWIKHWQEKRPLHLGPDQKPALSSASWDLDVALRFTKSFRASSEEVRFSVLLELKNHNGVSIEEISSFPHEHEVLIPSAQKFMIEHIGTLTNEPTKIIIRLRGIGAQQGASLRPLWSPKAA